MQKAKKILVIAGATYISGAEKVTIDVIRGLKENGYELHCMVSGWNDGDFIEALEKIEVPYTAIKLGWIYISKPLWTLDSIVHYPKAILKFLLLQKRFKADIVYIISYRPVIALYPFLKKNIIFHIHDPNSESKQSVFFLNQIKKKVKRFIAVSHFIQQDLIQCGISASQIEVVHNVVETNSNIDGHKIYMPDNVIRIGIVGQIIPRKGHEDLLEALKILKDKIAFKCLIFGNGDKGFVEKLRTKIQEFGIQDYVEWVGFVKDKEKIYETFDVMVAPTINNEPFALVALEAGANRVVSIVSESGGFPESIVNNETGFIVPRHSPAAISAKIAFLYENKFLLKKMGDCAFTNVKEKFILSDMIRKVATVLKGI